MKKHIGVITGATGYVGSHLAMILLEKGWEVHAIVRRGSNCESLRVLSDDLHIYTYIGETAALFDYFKDIKPEVVFHLAAAVKNDNKIGDAESIINANILFGTSVLEAMRYAGVKLIINTGTYWQNYNSDTYNPVNLYAATKEAFEDIIKYYVDAFHFRAITLRLYDIYGEDDKRPKLLNLLRCSTEDIAISPAEQYLDMVHISDVCEAYLKAFEWLTANPSVSNEKYGVYTGAEMMLKDVITMFEECLEKKLHVTIGGKPYKQREIMRPNKKIAQLPNWQNKVSLPNGLKLFRELGGVRRNLYNHKFAA